MTAVFLLPVSAFFSIQTTVRLASRFAPAVGWWLHGLLRWTFYGMIHAAIAAALTGMVESLSPKRPDWLLIIFMVGIPSLLLIRQVILDYAAARRRFGSIARAERARFSPVATYSQQGCQP